MLSHNGNYEKKQPPDLKTSINPDIENSIRKKGSVNKIIWVTKR